MVPFDNVRGWASDENIDLKSATKLNIVDYAFLVPRKVDYFKDLSCRCHEKHTDVLSFSLSLAHNEGVNTRPIVTTKAIVDDKRFFGVVSAFSP